MTETSRREAARQLRGSTLLLSGRLVAMVIALATQILIVRVLAKDEFGVFALGLTLVSSLRILVSFGDNQSVGRFLAMYEEQDRPSRFRGTLVLVTGKIAVVAAVLITTVVLFADQLTETFLSSDGLSGNHDATVLAILVLLAPIEAVGAVFGSLFAVLDRVGLVFLRRYLYAPLVRFLIVGWMAVGGYGAVFLAIGYVAGELLGLLIYGSLAVRALRERPTLVGNSIEVPTSEYLRFALPAGTVDLVAVVMNSVTVLVLGWYHGADAVADFRAVFPFGRLNQVVLLTFTVLFTPLAARFFARNESAAMERSYWQTSTYLLVLSFPVFAMSVPLASTTVPVLFGEQYASAASTLAVLGSAYFLHSAFGYNSLVLQTFGHVRWTLVANAVAVVVTLIVAFAVIPGAGSIGVSWSVLAGLAAQNIINQIGLTRLLGFGWIDRTVVGVGVVAVVLAAGLFGLERAGTPFFLLIVAAAVATAGLLSASRTVLDLSTVFPELRRFRLLGRLLP